MFVAYMASAIQYMIHIHHYDHEVKKSIKLKKMEQEVNGIGPCLLSIPWLGLWEL